MYESGMRVVCFISVEKAYHAELAHIYFVLI